MNQELYNTILSSYLSSYVVKPDGHTPLPFDHRLGDPDDRLYTITTFYKHEKFNSKRTPGITTSFDKANTLVEGNYGDIYEFSYGLVVVEAVMANQLYGNIPDEQYWYAWDQQQEKYVPIETPKQLEHTIGWGIG